MKDNSPESVLKTGNPLPLPVQRALLKLGDDLNRARRRRALTQQAVAERAGCSLNTIKRLEAGDPRMQWHVLARVLHLFGELGRLEELLDSARDESGLVLMDERLPLRVRPRKKTVSAF